MNVKAQANAMKMPTALTPMDLTAVPANRDSLETGLLVPVWYSTYHFVFVMIQDMVSLLARVH